MIKDMDLSLWEKIVFRYAGTIGIFHGPQAVAHLEFVPKTKEKSNRKGTRLRQGYGGQAGRHKENTKSLFAS